MAKSPNALELLRKDHRNVLTLLRRFERSGDEREQRDVCGELIAELDAHATLEEECFYPYVLESTDRGDLIEAATIEHDTAKDLMHELEQEHLEPARFHALVKVLGEYVTLHVREEEERIFPLVEKLGIDLEALGQELAERKGMRAQSDRTRPAGTSRKRTGRQSDNGNDRAPEREQRAPGEAAQARATGEGAQARATGEAAQARATGEAQQPRSDSTHEDDEFVREHGDELSRSTQAKWIHSVDEHEEHPGQTLATRNPDVIRRWAEDRDAAPATTPNGDPERPRVLRFDFPGFDKALQPVEWDAWLRVFEERDLVFLYQEHMKAGNPSNFFRLDSPHREDG